MPKKTIKLEAQFNDSGDCTDVDILEADSINAKEISSVGQVLVNKIQMAAQTLDVDEILEKAEEVDPRNKGGRGR